MSKNDAFSITRVRIVLFGNKHGFTGPVLKRLLANRLGVAAVVIAEPAQDGRSFPVTVKQPALSGGLEEMALKKGVEVLKTRDLDDSLFLKRLTEIQADLFLVACFSRKIPEIVWNGLNVPCWNLHPSLLPKYRGPSPLYWQIKNGETNTGLTLHEVTDSIDAGDIIARKSIPLPTSHDSIELDNWVAEHGTEMLKESLVRYCKGSVNPQPQDESRATVFPLPRG